MKAFYWHCTKCGEQLTDGQDVVFIAKGHMSGNTPALHEYTPYHEKCWNSIHKEYTNASGSPRI